MAKKRLNKKCFKILDEELSVLPPELRELFYDFVKDKSYRIAKCRKTVTSLRDGGAFKLYCKLHGK